MASEPPMTANQPDVAAIAKGLTKGQATCIASARHLDAKAYGTHAHEVTGRSANSLSLKGLAYGREIRSFTGRTRRGIALTPLGLAVRAYLSSSRVQERKG